MPTPMESRSRHCGEASTGEMRRVLIHALGIADRLEPRLARHEAWPHGLGDRLADLLDLFEDHMGREARGLGNLEAGVAALLAADHRAIGQGLQDVQRMTRRLTAPDGAGPEWKRLYALCRRLHDLLKAGKEGEDERLVALGA